MSLLLLTIFAAAVLLRVRVARKKKRSINYIYIEESPISSPANTRSSQVVPQGRRDGRQSSGRLLARDERVSNELEADAMDSLQKDLDAMVLQAAGQAAESKSSRQVRVHGVGLDQV